MFRPALRRAFPCKTRSFTSVKRCLATHASEQPSLQPGSFDDTVEENKPAASKNDENTALRSNLKIPVKPDHGLFHFFRRIKDEDTQKGYRYVSVEPTNDRIHTSSRAWTTAELRRKSFRDLHILWYMCQRERNLLATQKAEVRRLHHLASVVSTPITLRARMCRKTCARIKFVLNERRLAYLDATARLQWVYRPGYKDPARKPAKKLKRGPKLTEKEMKRRMMKLGKKEKLRLMHPELRKRPVMMLRWAARKGRASPMRFESDAPAKLEDEGDTNRA